MSEKKRYFIELSYDGTNYHGWQIQKNALSVQQLLNEKLSIILRETIEVTGCGRTDTGVHAKQYFAHFDAEGFLVDSSWFKANSSQLIDTKSLDKNDEATMNHEPLTINYDTFLRSINSILPKDIAVKRVFRVQSTANTRFDAIQRTYHYHIHFNKDPFKNGYSWELRDRPNIELMNEAARIITEYTDFSCFSKSNTQVKTNNCKITEAFWTEHDQGIIFKISADRFLRNMVRAIVGTLLMVGKGEIEPNEVRKIIESKNRNNAGTSVPACGLYLTKVLY